MTARHAPYRLLALVAVLVAGTGAARAAGTAAGTVISNQATVSFEDANGNLLSALSNIVTTTVSQVASVDVSPDGTSTATPGDVVYYAHIVTNVGNGADTIDMTAASSQGWGATLYQDVDGDGAYNAALDVVLSDSDGDGTPDTGSLPADAAFRILVAVSVPAGTADGTVDTTTVSGTSTFNPAVSESATDTATVSAPTLSVVKSVAPAGSQPPGATLTYTMVVTNGGTAPAASVVLTDPVPANTTYVPGSITEGGTGRTDAADADNADFDVTTPGAVTVDIGLLPASGGTTTITFQVTIN